MFLVFAEDFAAVLDLYLGLRFDFFRNVSFLAFHIQDTSWTWESLETPIRHPNRNW